MDIVKTKLSGVVLVRQVVHQDSRGWFKETLKWQDFCESLASEGLPIPPGFVQENFSCSRKGVLRGLHWQQHPHAQAKLIQVISGETFSVVVDMRVESQTFRQWMGLSLNPSMHCALWVPEGCAHGFLSLENETVLMYKATKYYNKESERVLRWNSPELGIDWPEISEPLIISDKDANAPEWVEELHDMGHGCIHPTP